MARDYVINGETLVRVKGGQHYSGGPIAELSELGLSDSFIRISPRWFHHDINIDDFGPNVPAEVMWQLSEVNIYMTLVHFDKRVLQRCMAEAGAGAGFFPGFEFTSLEGTMAPTGSLLGNYRPLLASGNHYISVNLLSPVEEFPWRFFACYLMAPPNHWPIGVRRSIVELQWRCIPYPNFEYVNLSGGSESAVPIFDSDGTLIGGVGSPGFTTIVPNRSGELISSGVILFDHNLDT